MLFCFIIVTTYNTNTKVKKEKESCHSNKYVIYYMIKTKTRGNWIKPHHNYLNMHILIRWSLIALYIKF
jgi:hypothetical protein